MAQHLLSAKAHLLPAFAAWVMLFCVPTSAKADLILGAGSATLFFQPWTTSSASVDLTIENTDSLPAFLNSANVALMLIPVGTPYGSLSMALSAPAGIALFTDTPTYSLLASQTLDAAVTINSQSYDAFDWTLVSNSNYNVNDAISASATANLAAITFTVGAEGVDTDGVWELWAVNEALTSYTAWSAADGLGGSIDGTFHNIPSVDGTAVRLTTITVPEPSTWAMLAVGAMTAGCRVLGRRRNPIRGR